MSVNYDLFPLGAPETKKGIDTVGVKDKKSIPKKLGTLMGNMLKRQDKKAEVVLDIPTVHEVDTVEDVEEEQRAMTQQQIASESSYHIVVHPAAFSEHLSPQEITDRMDTDHVIKEGPILAEQLKDDRPNMINYRDYYFMDKSRSEHELLNELHTFLETAVQCKAELGSDLADTAKSIQDNLTFIGENEYQEATEGIALYWKTLLDRHPDQQILALAGVDKEFGHYRDKKEMLKSDDYLLDNILAHFTDDEVEKYKGRLIVDSSEITAKDPEDLRVILLDDWTISGEQLKDADVYFRKAYPQFASSVEVQLIVASNDRITRGLDRKNRNSLSWSTQSSPDNELPVPVRAYFRAHDAPQARYTSAHITGSHSTVDHDFESPIRTIVTRAKSTDTLSGQQRVILSTMPALTDVLRPYRTDQAELVQKDRFK